MKKTGKCIRQIMSGAVTAALILILASVLWQKMTGEVPGLFGFHLMYVMTGSMSPEIEAGDAVLVRKAEADSLRLGDVICYYGTEGAMADQLITHKVIRTVYEENGERYLQTQGVANARADEPIGTGRVFGKVVLRLRLIGKLYRFFCTVPGLIAVLLPIVIMMISEIRQMVSGAKNGPEETEKETARADANRRKEENTR